MNKKLDLKGIKEQALSEIAGNYKEKAIVVIRRKLEELHKAQQIVSNLELEVDSIIKKAEHQTLDVSDITEADIKKD